MEECIKKHPKEFLNEDLKWHTQQLKVSTGRLDLTFYDTSERIVLLEIQKDAIDKHHLSKIIMYKQSLISEGYENPRLVLFCNRVREDMKKNVDDFIKGHDIQLLVMSESDFVKKVEDINPKLFLHGKKEKNNYFENLRKIEDKKLLDNHLDWLDFQKFKSEKKDKINKEKNLIYDPSITYIGSPYQIIEHFEIQLADHGINK